MSVVIHSVGPSAQSAPVARLPLWRFSVAQYHAMIRKGILVDGDPVELLDGLLVRKMTKNPPHRLATERTRRVLDAILPKGWHTQVQEVIALPTSEPEPDVMVVRGELDDYPDRHPGPVDVELVVEVADASLSQDQGFKKRLYAEATVALYWIINLVDRRLEVYTEPTGPASEPDYQAHRDFSPEDRVALVLNGREAGRIQVGPVNLASQYSGHWASSSDMPSSAIAFS